MRELPTGTVTLLFSDIEGSTHLLQQLGNRYALALSECRHLLREAFQYWNGYEVDTQGDARCKFQRKRERELSLNPQDQAILSAKYFNASAN